MGPADAMSGPNSVRSARARAFLSAFGGRGLARVQGPPSGPFKTPYFPIQLSGLDSEETARGGLHEKPSSISTFHSLSLDHLVQLAALLQRLDTK